MTTHFSQSVATIDSPTWSGTLPSLASGAYSLSSAINNTPTDGTTISYDMGDLTITMSTAITSGSGTPNIVVWILPAIDGTNYPNPPGSTAGAAPAALSFTFQQVASVSTSTIVCPNIPVPPCNFKILIQNNLGVAFSSGTVTAKMLRKTIANW